jgi:PhnB protein
MQLNPYLNFDGDCADAFRFYAECLGGRIVALQTHGDSPIAGQVPAAARDRILHARLEIGDQVLMGSDSPPGQHEQPRGVWVSVQVAEPAEAERVFHALAEGGAVRMPLQETFWAARFGMLIDRFGTPWMVNCDRPAG